MTFWTGGPVVTSPVIGAESGTNIDKPLYPGDTAHSDATAEFTLGAMVTGEQGKMYQFCRCTLGNAPANGTNVGITNGLTVAAATGNTWKNVSGTDCVAGDYIWLQANDEEVP